MSSFNKFFNLDTAKESSASVTPEHLLKLNSLIEPQDLPMELSPSAMNLQPSSFRVCKLAMLPKLLTIEAVTCQRRMSNKPEKLNYAQEIESCATNIMSYLLGSNMKDSIPIDWVPTSLWMKFLHQSHSDNAIYQAPAMYKHYLQAQ
jgi:hypothetical protein